MTSNVDQWVNIMLTVISSLCRIMRSQIYGIMTSMEPHIVTSSYRCHNDNTMTSNVEQWVNIMLTVISSSCRIMRSDIYVILMSYIAIQKLSFSTSQWYIIPISYHDVTETMSDWHHKLLLYLGVIFCHRFILPYKNTIIWFTLRHDDVKRNNVFLTL